MDRKSIEAHRRADIRAFVRKTFGLRGTLRLHRVAFGGDLLRAPLNVMLALVFLISRLVGLLAKVLRFHRTAAWLSRRKILLDTNVSRQVAARVLDFLTDLDAKGCGVSVADRVLKHQVANYTGVRSAVGEITTTFLIMIIGFLLFQTATPDLLSLAGPVAEMRAYNLASEQFPLGQGLGNLYYGIFATDIEPWQVVATGIALAMMASVVTAFAGIIVDPLQVITGTHQRRLIRLINRLEVDPGCSSGLAREHIMARLADITDMAINVWRALRS